MTLDPIAAAILASWSFEPEVVAGLALVTLVYLRGFAEIRAQLPARFPTWRRTAFLAGVGVVALALASPLDAFADLLLQVHMAQHWLLMMVAPPLLWLGAPAVPLLRGLPRSWLRRGLGPLLAWPRFRRGLARVTHPVTSWLAWSLTTLVWHAPLAYDAALRSRDWHDLEHATFLGASLLFWYPVLTPWPAHARPARAGLVLYLGAAAVFNTIFSATFAFSTRVFYTAYLDAPRPWGIDPLADQNAAGAFLWIAASLPMLVAAVALLVPMLDLPRERAALANARGPRRTPRRRRRDLLTLPVVGAALRSRRVRRTAQWCLVGVAALIVADGLFGPQDESAANLAGVLPWTYWRGFAVIGLLVLGNVFCAVCPFTLSRSLAGRWLGHRLPWPRALGSKWPAVALFVFYLFAYEAFALWDSPYWTAWLVLGYFAACFAIEGLFPRGTFCRHVCPIGQFHFASSFVSPLEVRRMEVDVCRTCRTHDCLRGRSDAPGCPTGLFLPTKLGSLDCTFCLDCVRACPHDNAGLVAVNPGASLGANLGPSAGVTALLLVFCFGAYANAAAMVAPVTRWEHALDVWLGAGTSGAPLALALGLAAALVVLPAGSAFACAALGRVLGRVNVPVRVLMARLAPALVPVGFAMWLAHFGSHLAAGIGTLGPAAARAARDTGLVSTSAPAVAVTTPFLAPSSIEGLALAVLGAGLVVSTAVAWRLALRLPCRPQRALGVAAPWALLATALYGAGVWILLQPMEMRGMAM